MTDTTSLPSCCPADPGRARRVYDALTAHLAERAGFAAVYVSGAGIAYTRLRRPDIGLVAMSEVADTVALIRDRVFGALISSSMRIPAAAMPSTWRARVPVRACGANAIQIEDQAFPKRCGHPTTRP
jgi:2-methylisocitrate lyase-like PEP mutase family enzyme